MVFLHIKMPNTGSVSNMITVNGESWSDTIVYGGNEIQSPSIWIDAQEPRICTDATHGPMYQSNVVGWFPLAYCSNGMCCKRCCWPQQAGSFVTQRQIGTGVTASSEDAQQMHQFIRNLI